MDPRIAARRAEVRESGARRDMRRVLRWMAVLAVIAVLAWVAQLPAFRVRSFDVTGVERADVEGALVDSGLVVDRPLVLLWPPSAEEALAEDPWVVDADVARRFPDTVVVRVTERRPQATVRADGRAQVVAGDGVVVSHVADNTLPVANLDGVAPGPVGSEAGDPRVRGIGEFVAALDGAATGSFDEADGELWFHPGGIEVRLGRPVDMAAKAASLVALLDEGVPAGATIHLVSAQRPAVEVAAPGDDAGADDEAGTGSTEPDEGP